MHLAWAKISLKLTHTPLAALHSSVSCLELHVPWNCHPRCLWKTRLSLLASHTPPCTSVSSSAMVGQRILQMSFGSDILWLHRPAWDSGHSSHLWLRNPEEGTKETQTNKQNKKEKKSPEEQGELSVESLKAHSVIRLAPWSQGKSTEAVRAPGVGEQRWVWTGLLSLTPPLSPESPPCCPALTQALDSKMGSQSSHLEIWGGKIKKGRKDFLPKKYQVTSI